MNDEIEKEIPVEAPTAQTEQVETVPEVAAEVVVSETNSETPLNFGEDSQSSSN